MVDSESGDRSVAIEQSSPRALFAQLVALTLDNAQVCPSPMATAYLIELLSERVCEVDSDLHGFQALTEMLLAARLESGAARIRDMRSLGDRALFVSGFFGDSLTGGVANADFYREVGQSAYQDVAVGLAGGGAGGSWTRLYTELAQDFSKFVTVLAEVGDRTRTGETENILRLYERYLSEGCPRELERLIRDGYLPVASRALRWWQ